MASVTEEELERERERNEKLRAQIADEQAKLAERANAAEREVALNQLKAEGARLEAQLNNVKESAKAASIKDGASGPLAQAQEQLKAAQAQANATVGTVDTNAGKSDKNEKNEKE